MLLSDNIIGSFTERPTSNLLITVANWYRGKGWSHYQHFQTCWQVTASLKVNLSASFSSNLHFVCWYSTFNLQKSKN